MPGIAVLAVTSGPGRLVRVKVRLEDGTIRQMTLPAALAGVSQIEWSAAALNALAQLPKKSI